uniref:Uncharacterized protein n=1 Tax=Arundo donax TaxID=35708 RepID=A0A0A9DUF9_ARUDO
MISNDISTKLPGARLHNSAVFPTKFLFCCISVGKLLKLKNRQARRDGSQMSPTPAGSPGLDPARGANRSASL